MAYLYSASTKVKKVRVGKEHKHLLELQEIIHAKNAYTYSTVFVFPRKGRSHQITVSE
jgi:hypothetical protein